MTLLTLESANLDPWNCRLGSKLCGEFGIVEMSQNFLLINYFFITFCSIKILKKTFEKNILKFKCFLILILIYEEISHLSYQLFKFTSLYNLQEELNIHNSEFLYKRLFINLPPFFSDNIFLDDINLNFLLGIIIIALLGFGFYIPTFSKIKLLLLEPRFGFIFLLYPINHVLSFLLRNIGYINGFLINFELIELMIYFYFVLDALYKFKVIRSQN